MNIHKCCICKNRNPKVDSTAPKFGVYGDISHFPYRFHGSCLNEVLDNPFDYDNKTVDMAIFINEQCNAYETRIKREEDCRTARLNNAKMNRHNC